MIIVIEGGDAAGKATQSKLLADRLLGQRFSFPNYESETGKAILGHLKKEWVCAQEGTNDIDGEPAPNWQPADNQLDALVFQCLQTANRLELLSEIRKAQARGHVVFDRYWQSAVVYGTLDFLDCDWLHRVQELPMLKADVNILIDVPVEEGFKRRPDRRDRYEMNRGYMERVRTEYLRLWSEKISGGVRGAEGVDVEEARRWFIVDGMGAVDEVAERIWNVVEKRGQ